jgi:hypothetical protein
VQFFRERAEFGTFSAPICDGIDLPCVDLVRS